MQLQGAKEILGDEESMKEFAATVSRFASFFHRKLGSKE
jgi:hypothetical protein